ncbi:MAG: RHS repeat-associated core domain-containing protein [Acidobacteriota bacterium]
MWKKDYIYRGGLLAGAMRETAEGGLRHFHLDHLGTPRVTTNSSGAVMSLNDYYPFGQEITSMRQQIAAGYDRDDPMKFTGHERDFIGGTYAENADNLDYMHAREYSAGVARFMSVDPADGIQRFPQSWNRYAYGRNNPLKYVDPTGLYVFAATCTSGDKQCQSDQGAFEQARQNDLQSHDAAVHAAAAAYGDPGVENGVTVAFGAPGQGAAGETGAFGQGHENGTVSLTANVLFQSGLRGLQLSAAVGHEGQHVLDAQGFITTFGRDASKQYGLTWDTSRNLTVGQTETNAYRITQSILASGRQSSNFGCNGCVLGTAARTPADVNLAITRILTNPGGPYAAKLNSRQVTGWDTPPQPVDPNP